MSAPYIGADEKYPPQAYDYDTPIHDPSLRGWLAGQALTALIAKGGDHYTPDYAETAGMAVKFADAILVELGKR